MFNPPAFNGACSKSRVNDHIIPLLGSATLAMTEVSLLHCCRDKEVVGRGYLSVLSIVVFHANQVKWRGRYLVRSLSAQVVAVSNIH
jgi:hypothetical protein